MTSFAPPRIGAPIDAQLPECQRLLPAAFPPSGRAPELLVASGDEGLRGVLAQAWTPGGFAILLHVLPRWRRMGIGRALLAQAKAHAQGETPALRAWHQVPQGSGADAFLIACGCSVVRRLLVFETDGARYQEWVRLMQRAGKRVPAALSVQPLAKAPQSVAAMVAAEFRVPEAHMADKLDPRHPDPYDSSLSQVLFYNGEPAGAILGRRYGNLIEVDVNMVAPHLRRGVANLMLLEALARLSREAGIACFRFTCEQHVQDTINIGRRADAVQRPDQIFYALELPATPA